MNHLAANHTQRKKHGHYGFTLRQLRAARAIVNGVSQRQALLRAGYSATSARCPGILIRTSWGLREEIRALRELRDEYTRNLPKCRKYARRPTAKNVLAYCVPEDRDAWGNGFVQKLSRDEVEAKKIAQGLSNRCSQCAGQLEGQDRWCPRCQPNRGVKSAHKSAHNKCRMGALCSE
jgi:hypothetical protein